MPVAALVAIQLRTGWAELVIWAFARGKIMQRDHICRRAFVIIMIVHLAGLEGVEGSDFHN